MARANKYSSLNFNDIYEKQFTNTFNTTNNHTNNNTSARLHNSSSSSATTPSSSASNASKTMISNSRIHGHMLVMTRPTPKPISLPPKQQQDHHVLQEKHKTPLSSTPPDQALSDPGSISLRPQGGTSLGSSTVASASSLSSSSPLKTDKFVPPHLRPGFVGREEKPGQGPGARTVPHRDIGGHRQGNFGSSPNRNGEDGRPKSGGGYDRIRRAGGEALIYSNRPGSSDSRPASSGR